MIIGITGTNGSGKGEVADYLVTKGFKHYSSRALIVEEVKRRGLPVNRDTMTSVSREMRASQGAACIVEALYKRAIADGGDAVIESIREIPGAEFLKSHGGYLIGVDANRELRYERAVKRNSSTDGVSFEKFVQQEEEELHSSDPIHQNICGVLKMADATVTNEGTREELHSKIDEVLEGFREQEKGTNRARGA